MKFSLSVLATALLASTAIAAPLQESRLGRRLARRSGNPMIRVPGPAIEGTPNGTATDTEYSENWAGAVYTAPPSGATFTAVSATFTVPTPTPTGSGAGSYSASSWVGIDGDTCGSAILQTGVDFTVTRSSSGALSYSYDAWYEWYPDYAYDYSSFPFAAGDVIVASVVSSSKSAGTASLENLTSGKKVSKALSAPSSSATLCGTNAEWIVEDYEEGSGMVPFASWKTVQFTNAIAKTNKGSETASGATPIDIQQNGKVLTSVSISGSNVGVSHT